jgi:hypothetical protein
MRSFPLRLTLPMAAVVLLPLLPVAQAAEPSAPPPFWPAERGPAPEQEPAPEQNPTPVQVASPVLRREAPTAVRDAIAALTTACAAWPKPVSLAIDRVPSSREAAPLPEEQACEMVVEPGRTFSLALWSGGVLGGVATILGLVGFCFLRMVLVQMWAWRPRAVTLPWS